MTPGSTCSGGSWRKKGKTKGCDGNNICKNMVDLFNPFVNFCVPFFLRFPGVLRNHLYTSRKKK